MTTAKTPQCRFCFPPSRSPPGSPSWRKEIAAAPLRPDVAMPILVGGFVFAADLVRALSREGVPLEVEMIWLRSYGDKRAASAISMIAGPSERDCRARCAGDRRRAGCRQAPSRKRCS